MAIKFILQDATTLREAYEARKEEYEALRVAGKWSGAISHGGILLELALKLAICKQIGETKLPTMYQIHDLELLLYCSGLRRSFHSNSNLLLHFDVVKSHWSIDLRYEGSTKTQADSDLVHQALFESSTGVLPFLSKYF